jgi:hypothetical protein
MVESTPLSNGVTTDRKAKKGTSVVIAIGAIGVTLFALSAVNVEKVNTESFRLQAITFQHSNVAANEDRSKPIFFADEQSQIPKAMEETHEPTTRQSPLEEVKDTRAGMIYSDTHPDDATNNTVVGVSSSPTTVQFMSRALEKHNLTLSARQQHKFYSKGYLLPQTFGRKKLFIPNTGPTAAFVLNEEFAYM